MELKLTDFPGGLAGLQYIREDGVVCSRWADHQWLISLADDGSVGLRRYYRGREDEVYAPLPLDQAAVALVAIINGYQPPRSLRRLETPFDQIQPDNGSANAV